MITNYEEVLRIENEGIKTTIPLTRTDRDGWDETYHQTVYLYNGKLYTVKTDRDGWPYARELTLRA
jgi:hypothetical protein